MSFHTRFIRFYFVTVTVACAAACLFATAPAAAQSSRNAAWWADASRILAGEDPTAGSALGKLANEPAVAQHRKQLAQSWSQFEASRLKPALRFSQAEIARQSQRSGPVFYPFSGPDALFALAMFPHAEDFALVGLEPVGDLPDLAALSAVDLAESLTEMRRSLRSITAYSFFMTNQMRSEFGKNRFSGVTPILLLFIARHGFIVQAVEPVIMEPDASLTPVAAGGLKNLAADRVPGVRIKFLKPGETIPRTLHYFRADLSNGGLARVSQPLKWAAKFAPKATYIKAASYLMHNAHFSNVRDFILASTEMVVQDDSGIPLRLFTTEHWDHAYFGTYDGPIRLFAKYQQNDLLKAYESFGRPLEFGIGYDFQAKTSNIQRFIRKRAAVRTGAVTPPAANLVVVAG